MKGAKIIIKKVKKKGHAGGHGGAWKVAYADFVTAMMAFFLLLWLLSMTSDEQKAALANYFKYFALFDSPGATIMSGSVDLTSEGAGVAQYMVNVDGLSTDGQMGEGSIKIMSPSIGSSDISKEEMMERLREDIEEKLYDVKDQVMVDIFEGGVRIQLVDKDGSSMFALGKSELTRKAIEILMVLTPNINEVENFISIEGHTDALTYSSNKYTNWELSTERASAARRQLEQYGMSPDRISRVSGYAATDPLIKDDPDDPRNRRISILLLYPKVEEQPKPNVGINVDFN